MSKVYETITLKNGTLFGVHGDEMLLSVKSPQA
jgi:hypothetical protein